jgi:hypothetical protein
MSAPITHVVLASKVFDKYFPGLNRKEFMVGTIVPDIRYIGAIDRDKTHFENVTLKEVQKLDSFNAGLKFHSLVDKVRKAYVKSREYYSLFPKSDFVTQASKIFEDQIFYNKVKNWTEIADYFKVVYKEELDLGLSEEAIEKWHKMNRYYFSHAPEDADIAKFTKGLGFSSERAKEISKVIQDSQRKKVESIELDFYDKFETFL